MSTDKRRIGLAITTFNSESYFKALYDTIPFDIVDEVVVVNGGAPYERHYEGVHWIQHETIKYPSVARNDGLNYLKTQNIDYFFICEDDMIIKNPNIFQAYIDAHEKTNIHYFIYASNAWNSGPKGNRTPLLHIRYTPDTAINLYANMCNEFTFHTRQLLDITQGYDEQYKYLFDVDYTYRASTSGLSAPFWYFPDIPDSDDYIDNNPVAVSRLDSDGSRITKLTPEYERFHRKYDKPLVFIDKIPEAELIDILKKQHETTTRH